MVPNRRVDILRNKTFLAGLLLVAATVLLYAQVLHHDFIPGWDDDVYITANPHVTSGLKAESIRWSLTALEPFYWHPITWWSHMLDAQLFGMTPGPHHFVNAILQALNALLLFVLLWVATGSQWRSLVAAGVFALHPLNVETVAWAAERKSLLSLFFSLLTVGAYGWYVRQKSWKRYLVVVAGLVLALMCKPAAVTLPVVLLFLDYWPLRREEHLLSRGWLRLGLEKLPLLAIGLGVSAITFFGERTGGTMVPFSVLPLYTRIENAVISYLLYLGKIVWPANLSVFYPHPASVVGPNLPMGQVLPSGILLASITGVVLHFRRTGYLVFGWCFYLLTMLPMIGIIQVGYQGMQDHFAYVPAIGIFVALTWALGDVIERLAWKPAIAAVASAAVLLGLGMATNHYLKFWTNGVQLFGHARAAAEKPNPWLEQLYANALYSSGRTEEAFQHYQNSCALGPRNEFCHYKMAEILYSRGQLPQALREFQITLRLTQKSDIALGSLVRSGHALLQLGEYEAARQAAAEALRIDPQSAEAQQLQQDIFMRGRGN